MRFNLFISFTNLTATVNQVLVQILDSAVHLHDLNDLINTKPPLNKGPEFSTPTTRIPPAICISKNMQKKLPETR